MIFYWKVEDARRIFKVARRIFGDAKRNILDLKYTNFSNLDYEKKKFFTIVTCVFYLDDKRKLIFFIEFKIFVLEYIV